MSTRRPDPAVSGTKVAPAAFVTSNRDGFRCLCTCDGGGGESKFGFLDCTAVRKGEAFRVYMMSGSLHS